MRINRYKFSDVENNVLRYSSTCTLKMAQWIWMLHVDVVLSRKKLIKLFDTLLKFKDEGFTRTEFYIMLQIVWTFLLAHFSFQDVHRSSGICCVVDNLRGQFFCTWKCLEGPIILICSFRKSVALDMKNQYVKIVVFFALFLFITWKLLSIEDRLIYKKIIKYYIWKSWSGILKMIT